MNCHSSGRKVFLRLFIKLVIKLTSNYRVLYLFTSTNKILSNILSRLTPYIDEIIGVTSVYFIVTDNLLIRYWRKNRNVMGQYISCL